MVHYPIFLQLFCFDVDDFASQRQIAISCLPGVTQEWFLCSVRFIFLLPALSPIRLHKFSWFFFIIDITDFDIPSFKLKSLCGTPYSDSSIIFIFASKLIDFIFPILNFKK
jgi:hypothetical protein